MIPIILAVSAKQDGSVNTILDGIKKQALVLGQGIGANLIPPSALTGLTAAQTQMGVLAQRSQSVAKELADVRKQLDDVARTPGIAGQAAALNEAKTRLQAIGAANGDVLASNRQLAASYKTLSESAGQGLQNIAGKLQNLAQVGQLVTGAFAGIGTIFGGAAAGALVIAANFEQLQAKLVSVTGSVQIAAEKFQFAQEFAAKTPFDVEGIVSATAVLEGFGLKSEQVLPVAANLAAAMGTSLSEATLTIGKAAAGSLEGFESLRNTYAISTSDLQKFGLQVDKTGGILSRTPAQIEKNRNALISLINLRYGDAIERQSNTLNGALSNVGDSASQLAASFGSTLIPVATGAARALSGFLGFLNGIPAGFKAAAAGTAVLIAGVSLTIAGVAGLATSLALVQAQLLSTAATLVEGSLAATALGTASGLAGTGLTFLTRSAGFARTALLGFAAANPILLATLAVVTALSFATNKYGESQKAIGDAITAGANKFAQANSTLRQTITSLNEAGKATGTTVGIVSSSKEQFAQLQEAFKKLSPEEIVVAFSKAGESTESLKGKLKSLEAGAGQAGDKLKLLAAARTASENNKGEEFLAAAAALKDLGIEIDVTKDVMGQLEAATKATKLEFDRLGQAKFALQGVVAAFEEFAAPLEKITKDSKDLREFLDVSKSVGTTKALASALKEVGEQIKTNSNTEGVGTDNLDKLLPKLRDPNASATQKAAIQEQIKLVQERTALEKVATDKRLDANRKAFELDKALNDKTLQQELKFVQDQVKIAQKGSDEQVALLTKEAQLKDQILEKQASIAQKQFSNVVKAAATDVKDAQGNEDVIAVVEALEQARAKVDAWALANKGLLQTYPAIQAEVAKFRADNSVQLKAAETRVLAANYQRLGQDIQTALSNAINNTQKLDAVNRGLAATQASRRLGLISEVQAQTQINQLTKQKEQIEKSITAEKAQQAQTIANQELANAEQELQILQARKANGEKVDAEILARQKDIFQQKLNLIEQERIAAVEAANGEASAIEAINKTAALKKTNAINAETLAREQALDQQTAATDKALGAQEARYDQFQNRIGGRNSPLQSFEEAFGGPGSFGLGNFSLDAPLKKAAAQTQQGPNSLRRIQAQVNTEANGPNSQAIEITKAINESARDKRRAGKDARLGLGGGAEGGTGSGGGGQTTVSIYVDGAKMEVSEPEINDSVKKTLNRVASKKRMRGL